MAASATCAACGKALEDRRRRYCSTVCKDRARRERAEATAVQPSPIAGASDESARGGRRGRLLALGALSLIAASGVYLLRRRR